MGFVGCDMGLNFVVVRLVGGYGVGILGWCYGFMGTVVCLEWVIEGSQWLRFCGFFFASSGLRPCS